MASRQADFSGVSCSPISPAPGVDTGATSLRRSVARALSGGASESWFVRQYTPPGPKPALLRKRASPRQGPLRPAGHEPVTAIVVDLIRKGLQGGGSVEQIAEGLHVGQAAVEVIALRLARSKRAAARKAEKLGLNR